MANPREGALSESASEYSLQLLLSDDRPGQVHLHHVIYYCTEEGVCKMKALILALSIVRLESSSESCEEHVIKYILR